MSEAQAAANQTTGTITKISNYGTIVVVFLTTNDHAVVPVYFEHRPFRWLLDAEGCTASELIGRPAAFDGEGFSFED